MEDLSRWERVILHCWFPASTRFHIEHVQTISVCYICTSMRSASTEDCISGNETLTQNACVRDWFRSKSLWPVMTLVQITHYTSPSYTDHPQGNIHCIENFFTVQDIWATCACPEKQILPWKFSLYWIYFLPFWIFEQLCACPEKQSLPWKFSLHWTYILHSGFWRNLRLPWKTECALN